MKDERGKVGKLKSKWRGLLDYFLERGEHPLKFGSCEFCAGRREDSGGRRLVKCRECPFKEPCWQFLRTKSAVRRGELPPEEARRRYLEAWDAVEDICQNKYGIDK